MTQSTQPERSDDPDAAAGRVLKVLSYNIQVGIATAKPHHYLTHSWKHVLPHSERLTNLDSIAHLISNFDLVGLQEVDAGSLRSGFINLTEYLAHRAQFPFWHHRVNRRIGRFAQNASGLLSRLRPTEVMEHKLPGLIPGRGLTLARFGSQDESLAVINLHLSLSRRARMLQLGFVAELASEHPHVILMGDLNCQPNSAEMRYLFRTSSLREPTEEFHTFPSWQPMRNIDHILVTPSLQVRAAHVLSHSYSDHLPIAMELVLPETLRLP